MSLSPRFLLPPPHAPNLPPFSLAPPPPPPPCAPNPPVPPPHLLRPFPLSSLVFLPRLPISQGVPAAARRRDRAPLRPPAAAAAAPAAVTDAGVLLGAAGSGSSSSSGGGGGGRADLDASHSTPGRDRGHPLVLSALRRGSAPYHEGDFGIGVCGRGYGNGVAPSPGKPHLDRFSRHRARR